MMGIRIACFILMVVVTPYSWYTWVFAAGAIVIPYIAVVVANVGPDTARTEVIRPERALPSTPTPQAAPSSDAAPVLRIQETRAIDERRPGAPE